MKKWYVITGILALLLIISMSTCSGNSDKVDRLQTELAQTKAELKAELAQLRDIKELDLGNGLRLFELSAPEGYFSEFTGKVQNISTESMGEVKIIVVSYYEDGGLSGLSLPTVYDLYPQEIAQWTAWPGPGASYAIYAFGNKGD